MKSKIKSDLKSIDTLLLKSMPSDFADLDPEEAPPPEV